MKNITDEQKIYELSRLWKEAAYNFAFWDRVDIDWDGEYKKALGRVLQTKDIYEYYRELIRFYALLGDGHTEVSMPMEVLQDLEYFSMLPVFLWRFGDRTVVLSVSEQLKDSLPILSELKRVDGIDAEEYIRESCYPYIWHGNEAACGRAALNWIMYGRRGSRVTLTFEKDGITYEHTLERGDPTKMSWYNVGIGVQSEDKTQRVISSSDVHSVRLTEDNIAIIKMTSFADNTMPEKIYACFDELKAADGYILDVRGNTGGNSSNGFMIASMFIDGDYICSRSEMQVYEPTYKAWSVFREDFRGLSLEDAAERYRDDAESLKTYRSGRNMYYLHDEETVPGGKAPGRLEGPIVVLMNEYTFSAGEDFVDVMKAHTDAVFIGMSTAGSSGQPLFEMLESGGSFRICTRRCIAQNGENIYNKGFAPDIPAAQTPEDYAAGFDRAMEKGLEVLREKLGRKS